MAPEDILLTWNPRVAMWNGEHWEEVPSGYVITATED